MTRIHGFLVVALAGWSFLALTSPPPTQVPRVPQGAASQEIARIQAHLAGALDALRAADTAHLTPAQLDARQGHIRRLADYRNRGVFPHNHDFPNQFVPYFVDEHGTHCAVGYLIHASGRDDIVELVAERSNNARVTELAADPEIGPALASWLDESGLTVAEAQRIQPSYGIPSVKPDTSPSTGYILASSGISVFNLGASAANVISIAGTSSDAGMARAGILTGTAGMVLGLYHMNDEGTEQTLAIGNMALGIAAVASGTWALLQNDSAPAAGNQASRSRVRIVPLAALGPDTGPVAGVRVAF